jgi:hypothetical protein
MHTCSKCKIEKLSTEFHKRNNRPCGVRSICKQCYKGYEFKRRDGYMREYDLMKSYSITVDDYNRMFESQYGKCAICGTSSSVESSRKKYLCVDHNHETGKVRGLLCDKCNRGIGLLNDDIQTLISAIKYLQK